MEVQGEDPKAEERNFMWGLAGILWVPSLSQEDYLSHILVSTLLPHAEPDLVYWTATRALKSTHSLCLWPPSLWGPYRGGETQG